MSAHASLRLLLAAALLTLIPAAPLAQPGARADKRPPDDAVAVQVQLDYFPAGQKEAQALPISRVMSPGDEYALRVTVESAAFLRVFAIDAIGEQSAIYPEKGQTEQRVEAGSQVVLPGSGKRFKIEQDVGEQNVFVIASAAPLQNSDPALHREVMRGSAPSAPSAPGGAIRLNSGSESPPPSSQGTRPPPEPIRTTERSPGQLKAFIEALGSRARQDRAPGRSGERARAKSSGVAVARVSFRVGARVKQP